MSESRIAFISAPVVKLISSPRFHEATLAEAIPVIPASVTSAAEGDALAEVGGRICYDSFAAPRPGGNGGYIAHIKEVGHGSVLEHANYSFLLAGISRPCAQQITRHRAGFGFSMRSQRYVDESNGAIVIPPEYLAPDAHNEHTAFISVCANQWAAYRALVELTTARIVGELARDHGAPHVRDETNLTLSREQRTEIRKRARQAARGALPINTATALLATANARAWRHFVEDRGSAAADIEIRRVAIAVLLVLRRVAPNTFADYEIRAEPKPAATKGATRTWPVGTAWAPGTIHTATRKV